MPNASTACERLLDGPEQHAPCDLLAWDTAFWGMPIARLRGTTLTGEQVRRVDAWCRRGAIRCLYLLAAADDRETIRQAEGSGFRLVDIRVTLHRGTTVHPSLRAHREDGAVTLRSSRPEDVPVLRRIAAVSYHDTRFYYDGNFPTRRCAALYETWIQRSCEGHADVVLVAEINGEPVGYVTVHRPTATTAAAGTIGLIAVASRAQGLGVGQLLVEQAIEWSHAQGIAEVAVATQGRNVAAQRLYQRCGFIVRAVQLWYHKWYPLPEREGLRG